MESRVGPSAWRRACTDFWAPLPSATIVITAPTPMMMPSMVRNDRSLLARIAWSATWKISSSSILGSGRSRLRARRRGGLLLLHAREPAAGEAAHALLHVALGIDERRARQHQHGVLLGEPVGDLDVIEVGQPGTDLDGRGFAVAQHEDDVARHVTAAPRPAASTASAAAHALELGAYRTQRGLLGGRQLLARHALLKCRADLRLGDARRQRNRP